MFENEVFANAKPSKINKENEIKVQKNIKKISA